MEADTLHRIVKNPKNPCRDSHRRRDGFFVRADNKPRLERMLRARRGKTGNALVYSFISPLTMEAAVSANLSVKS